MDGRDGQDFGVWIPVFTGMTVAGEGVSTGYGRGASSWRPRRVGLEYIDIIEGQVRWGRNPWPGVPPLREVVGKPGHWVACVTGHTGVLRTTLPDQVA